MNIIQFCISLINDEVKSNLSRFEGYHYVLIKYLHLLTNAKILTPEYSCDLTWETTWDSLDCTLDTIIFGNTENLVLDELDTFLGKHYNSSDGLLPSSLIKLSEVAFILEMRGLGRPSFISILEIELTKITDIEKNPLNLIISTIVNCLLKRNSQKLDGNLIESILRNADSPVFEHSVIALADLYFNKLVESDCFKKKEFKFRKLIFSSLDLQLRNLIIKRIPVSNNLRLVRLLIAYHHLSILFQSIDLGYFEETEVLNLDNLKQISEDDPELLAVSTQYLSQLSNILNLIRNKPALLDFFWYGGISVLIEAAVTEKLREFDPPKGTSWKKWFSFKNPGHYFEDRWTEYCSRTDLDIGIIPMKIYEVRNKIVHAEKRPSNLDKKVIVAFLVEFLETIS